MNREESHRESDDAELQEAWNAPNPVPGYLYQETDSNIWEGYQAAASHDIEDVEMDMVSENNNVLAQSILLDIDDGS